MNENCEGKTSAGRKSTEEEKMKTRTNDLNDVRKGVEEVGWPRSRDEEAMMKK